MVLGQRILGIAAHPDDEILGCSGTIARQVQEGDDVYIAIFGEGIIPMVYYGTI